MISLRAFPEFLVCRLLLDAPVRHENGKVLGQVSAQMDNKREENEG